LAGAVDLAFAQWLRESKGECQIQGRTRDSYFVVPLASNIRKRARRNGMRMLEPEHYSGMPCDGWSLIGIAVKVTPILTGPTLS